ncbi:hypothetical protein [Robiginitomaculum antarcticum]|uniref:hypothetical protein n=1 Tax=Robiginitomaculum antarcticum TaxID=437507 RepID=UPI00037E6F06|nr:hypothetical protein [Robiginitomaculum antarcticum]
MNLIQTLWRGMVYALSGNTDWRTHFNLRRNGIWAAYAAMIAGAVFYGVMAYAFQVNSGAASQTGPALAAIFLSVYVFSFALYAYGAVFFLNRIDDFRPWLIVRSFIAASLTAIMAIVFGLFLIGILPFQISYWAALCLFIAQLLVDIRLAQTVLDQDWIPSIFIGIGVHVTALILLLGALASVAY